MSALARYFRHRGYAVAGYDRTPSPLTKELENEGIDVIYEDDLSALRRQKIDMDCAHTLVVRTPAVPEDSIIYTFLREQNFDIRKRAEVLGLVTRQMKALCVAGTHGKTTTSTMLAHLLNPVNAFLGGISMNYHTNLSTTARSIISHLIYPSSRLWMPTIWISTARQRRIEKPSRTIRVSSAARLS